VSTDGEAFHEFPNQDPLAAVAVVEGAEAAALGLRCKLEAILTAIENKKPPKRAAADYQKQVEALKQEVVSLSLLLSQVPGAAKGADIGMDIGQALQKLGMWPAVEALQKEENRKAGKRDSDATRSAVRTSKVQQLYKMASGENPDSGEMEIQGKIASKLGIALRTVRYHLKKVLHKK
jgi:hypothetical protein